ncbi:glycoside hydrolase family 74 protein [Thermothelomyces heterothallicus CBS 202.75]|uniref:glycoside hydrolase family 74 protein n=1 Tax=Thermothelomyces heterothallicus CBS 202.75 TaxID=1149848 RepID=UPI003743E7A5
MKGTSALQLLLAAAAAVAPAGAATAWKNVNIGGGGGFVPGIIFHPKEKGVAYARTDIGGLYRLNPNDDSWTPLTDNLGTNEKWGRWGIDAVAVDPQDADKVYAAVGMYTNDWDPNPGSIIRSSDRGATWEVTELPFKVGGNMPGRGMGERLAVDPANSDILFFGARSGNGLWKSADGGVTWARVKSFTNVGTYAPDPSDATGLNSDLIGLTFVTFDSTSDVVGGATSRIFVGTADNKTASVYVSEDAGATWSPVDGQPRAFFPHKCVLQPEEKALYLSYSDGAGPYDGTLGAVYRYDLAAGTWTDITPASGGDLYFGFGGLGVDLRKPGTLMVATLNSWWPDAQIYRSTDSGATWSKIWEWAAYPNMNWYYGLYTDKAPWINAGFISQDTKRLGWMIEALVIDPHDSDHWLYGTGLTLYGGHDLTKWDTETRNVTISSLAAGIEEMAVLGLASPANGSELLAAVGDDCGFTFRKSQDLGTSPQTPWMNPIWTSTTDVDYAGNEPDHVVRVGNSQGSPQVAVSEDGGVTWRAHPGADDTTNSGTLAYSADADTIVWSSGSAGVLRSQNQGAFASVGSLPSGATVAADRRNNTVFYAASGASFYRSTDTGATFAKVASAFGGNGSSKVAAVKAIAAHPVVAGEVWVATDAGLFRSTDYGVTFSAASGSITDATQVSLGKGDGSAWNVYVFGTGPKGTKLYASADEGATWVDIQGEQGFGSLSANRLVGSGNVAGQVYVGTNGRGVFYAKVSLSAAAAN